MTDTAQTEQQNQPDPSAAAGGGKAKAKAPEPTRFPLSRLLHPKDGPRIAGHPLHVIAGALHGLKADAELSREEIADRIDEFLKHEVKTG